jgi:hypothetical protein
VPVLARRLPTLLRRLPVLGPAPAAKMSPRRQPLDTGWRKLRKGDRQWARKASLALVALCDGRPAFPHPLDVERGTPPLARNTGNSPLFNAVTPQFRHSDESRTRRWVCGRGLDLHLQVVPNTLFPVPNPTPAKGLSRSSARTNPPDPPRSSRRDQRSDPATGGNAAAAGRPRAESPKPGPRRYGKGEEVVKRQRPRIPLVRPAMAGLVRVVGLEPTRLAARVFETPASTIPPHPRRH